MRKWIVAILVLHAAAAPLLGQSGSRERPITSPVLRAGDAVRIAVWQRPDLSGQFSVGTDGRMAHPILQGAVVAGVPFEQARNHLAEVLRTFQGDAQFVAEPFVRIGVGGEVRQPNLYHVPAEMTLAYAVAQAGGPTERGRLDRVELVRDGRSETLDLTDPSGHGAGIPLRSGDEIRVGRRRDILREYFMPLASIVGAVAAVIQVSR